MDANNYEVFEEHLRHLEEQLVTLTIENQNLGKLFFSNQLVAI